MRRYLSLVLLAFLALALAGAPARAAAACTKVGAASGSLIAGEHAAHAHHSSDSTQNDAGTQACLQACILSCSVLLPNMPAPAPLVALGTLMRLAVEIEPHRRSPAPPLPPPRA